MSGITDKAEQLLEDRMSSIRDLEKYAGAVEQARHDLQAAEQSLAKAWTAATRAGWSEDELRKLGVAKPTARRGRPKGSTKTGSSARTAAKPGSGSDTPDTAADAATAVSTTEGGTSAPSTNGG